MKMTVDDLMSALAVYVHANRRQSHRHREMDGNVYCALLEKERRLHVCVVNLYINWEGTINTN